MKSKYKVLAGAFLASCVSLTTWAQPASAAAKEPAPAATLGKEKPAIPFNRIQIKNYQDESIGRIKDLGIDLINGRIVEALVESDSSLDVGGKVVGVPALALVPDPANDVYRLDISVEDFKAAAAIDLSKWDEAGRSDRVAAAYRLFGQEPYFLEEGMKADAKAKRPKVALGYVQRASKITDMSVTNLQNEKLGKVYSMTLDIPTGRILSVIIVAPGNFKTKSVIPAMALRFDDTRKGLLLDESKAELADEPRYVFTESAFGNEAHSEEQSLTNSKTAINHTQGRSYRDVDRTVQISRGIRAAKIASRHVQIRTMDGRVTLLGWVDTAADKASINAIAVASSSLELVDNELTVGKPASE